MVPKSGPGWKAKKTDEQTTSKEIIYLDDLRDNLTVAFTEGLGKLKDDIERQSQHAHEIKSQLANIQSLTHDNNYSREHSKHGTPFDKCRRLNFGLAFELGRMSRPNNRGTGPFCNASGTLWQSSACPLPVITK